MSAAVEVRPVAGRADLERFLRLPWRIYADDPHWVPPLLSDVRRRSTRRSTRSTGTPTSHVPGVARPRAVGRIAAIVNRAHNEFHEDRTRLLRPVRVASTTRASPTRCSTAEAWLRERGMTACAGPDEPVDERGDLLAGRAHRRLFHRPPVIMMAHTPPYYARCSSAPAT
jgi:hypothetical protein